jgi:uncharacterized protein (DUF1684 family)
MDEEHEHHAANHEHHHDHEHIDYADAVRAYRADKDEYFRHGRQSPVPADQRQAFEGIPYFDVDEDLVFEDLRLEAYDGPEPTSFQMPTSDGRLRAAQRAGVLRFEIDGTRCSLTGYTFEGGAADTLFVPFLDRTAGTETYGAGRYLDLVAEDDGTYVIDFNLAYHPSCVYDSRYSCPIPPPENRLPVRIAAGERLADTAAH